MSWKLARAGLQMADVAVAGLEFLEKVTGIGGPKAELALATARATIGAIKAGFAGEATPQEILAQLEHLHERLSANDAEVDELAKSKFGPTS